MQGFVSTFCGPLCTQSWTTLIWITHLKYKTCQYRTNSLIKRLEELFTDPPECPKVVLLKHVDIILAVAIKAKNTKIAFFNILHLIKRSSYSRCMTCFVELLWFVDIAKLFIFAVYRNFWKSWNQKTWKYMIFQKITLPVLPSRMCLQENFKNADSHALL